MTHLSRCYMTMKLVVDHARAFNEDLGQSMHVKFLVPLWEQLTESERVAVIVDYLNNHE